MTDLLLAAQHGVQETGFADIAAAQDCYFRHHRNGDRAELLCGPQEFGRFAVEECVCGFELRWCWGDGVPVVGEVGEGA